MGLVVWMGYKKCAADDLMHFIIINIIAGQGRGCVCPISFNIAGKPQSRGAVNV